MFEAVVLKQLTMFSVFTPTGKDTCVSSFKMFFSLPSERPSRILSCLHGDLWLSGLLNLEWLRASTLEL